jgi:glutamyl-tRNA reductase
MALAITNQEPGTLPIDPGAAVWRTCLREVTFGDDADEVANGNVAAKPLVEGEAYRLLLEILCGLQSPMLGETQVMGQFKTFLASLTREQSWLNRLGQRLLADARDIRTRHLQGLGSRSYGSAVRRYLSTTQHAVLVGTGKLAHEVLPFLADDGRGVDQWGRNADTSNPPAPLASATLAEATDRSNGRGGFEARSSKFTYRLLDSVDTFAGPDVPTALIIAAPVPSDMIDRVAACYSSLCCVIDLRGELGSAPLNVKVPVISLQDLFARMTATHGSAARHVEAARAEIASRSRRYELRDELRPFGWDDLCA